MRSAMEVLDAEVLEEEAFVRALMAERAEFEATIAACEFEKEMDVEGFHRWLNSLEPTMGELEARDLGDCGFGHVA